MSLLASFEACLLHSQMAKETQNGVVSTADESASYGENEQKAPNGGTQAWLVVLGAFISMFCTQGYIGSFG
jgi:hypothetical protein